MPSTDTEPEYTFNPPDCKHISVSQLSPDTFPAFGFQFNSTNVGKAKDKSIYAEYHNTSSALYNIRHLQTGNVVSVKYQNRTIKTPYRIAYLNVGDPITEEHRDWKRIIFGMVLEPFNSRANQIITAGNMKYKGDKENPESKYMIYNATNTIDVDNITHVIDDLQKSDTPIEDLKYMGRRCSDFHSVEIYSDLDINKLFELNESQLVTYTI